VIAPVDGHDPAAWRDVIETNLTGAFTVARAAVPSLRAAGHGRFVGVASISGLVGTRSRAAYAASKAGLIGLVRALAAELGPSGATANAVALGAVGGGMAASIEDRDPERFRRLSAAIPTGRFARLDEAVAPIAFLASPEASYVNGHVLVADGGWTATLDSMERT
jgi:NAD(P)-dependent dehydrogenase (short-subunit alcohol dehydrogenase family)